MLKIHTYRIFILILDYQLECIAPQKKNVLLEAKAKES